MTRKKKILFVLLHAAWLLLLTIILQYTSLVKGEELSFFRAEAIVKKLVFRDDEQPLGKQILFIDMSYDLALMDHAEIYLGAKTVIRDRKKLARLLSILKRPDARYQYALCDILMTDSVPEDSLLRPVIEKVPRLILSSVFQDEHLIKPIFKVASGCVNYQAVNGSTFVKMPIFVNDTIKSLPATLCELTGAHRFTRKDKITFIDNRPSFNYVIPDFYYRPANVDKTERYPLGKLMLFSDSTILAKIKGKFLVIGDFTNDIHTTYLGSLPGSYVLLDTFLTLKNTKAASMTWPWLCLLFLVYSLISYYILTHRKTDPDLPAKLIKNPLLNSFFTRYVSFLGICVLLNTISYLFFGIFISMLYISLYLTMFEYIMYRRDELRVKVKSYFQFR